MKPSLSRCLASEALSTAFLLAAVVGSGIMGDRLSGGNVGIALLANTLATAATLVTLIITFGSISAHMNPAVTLASVLNRELAWGLLPGYVAAQMVGAFSGVAAAHAMFGEPWFSASQHVRTGGAQWFSEFVATFGLVLLIGLCSRTRPPLLPAAVATYIAGAYWFTASTSFANPAVTVARSFTNTFAGIRPQDAPGFIASQLAGTLAAVVAVRWFFQEQSADGR